RAVFGARHHRRICRPHPARGAQVAGLHRGRDRERRRRAGASGGLARRAEAVVRRLMSVAIVRSRALAPLAQIVDALADPRRSHRTAAALLVVYALLWWAYALIAKSTQDIHFDMGEVFSWSTELAYGYPKHPPFPAWIAAAWFAVFPRADWAYYLLSAV